MSIAEAASDSDLQQSQHERATASAANSSTATAATATANSSTATANSSTAATTHAPRTLRAATNATRGRGRQMSDGYMWKEQHQFRSLMKGGHGGEGGESESDVSESEQFLTKGAFLLTPSHGLTMERAAGVCDKMEYKGCFSLTKTATGILFKFSNVDDYHMVYRKGFHKVTGSRFYRKIAIPCRPQNTFTLYVYDIPDEVPEEDVRHALRKLCSVLEVTRLQYAGSVRGANLGSSTPKLTAERTPPRALAAAAAFSDGEPGAVPREGTATGVVRVTLASAEEAGALLHCGLDFYGATHFPVELANPALAAKLTKPSRVYGGGVSARVRDLLPVFDQQGALGLGRVASPACRLLKPPSRK